jgi:DNA-binding transcriptional LysR family regulator
VSILNLDLHQLMVFNTVAAEESIAIAADKLCLTQPTVSYHLKSIEKYAGAKLFYIKKQRVYLTDSGKELYRHTQEIWAQLKAIDKQLTSMKQKPIRIGVTPLLQNQVASALSKVHKQHPEINFEIIYNPSTKVIQAVSELEMEVGVVVRTDYGSINITAEPLSENERLVFVASPKLPIAHKSKVEWADLEPYPIICGSPGSLLNELVTDKFRNAGLLSLPHLNLNTLSLEANKIFVKEGEEIGLWHVKDVEREFLAGELSILPLCEEITVAIDLILNNNENYPQPIIKSIQEYIKRELKKPSYLIPEKIKN